MLWLFDSAGAQQAYLHNVSSAVMTRRFQEHSEIAIQLPVSAFDKAFAAYFALVEGDPTVYLAEDVEFRKPRKGSGYVDMRGRDASALLHTRAIEGTFTWAGVAPGQMIKDILDSFTGARAIPLVFGTGNTLGTPFSMQRSNEDAGNVVLEILAASGLGMRTRMNGATPTLDVYAPSTTAVLLGDKHGTGSSASYVKSIGSWKTYAIVLGRGVGDERTRVDVDMTGGTLERRELVVDAKDISPDGLTAAQYEAALAARGTAKLEETCKIEYGTARIDAPLDPGDLAYYDAKLWAAEKLVTEATEVREGGKRQYSATLGSREPSVWQTVARVAAGAVNIDGGNVHNVGAAGEPAFTNSWVNQATGGAHDAQFYKDALGRVWVFGRIKNGTMGAGAFTLPAGFRPSAIVGQAVDSNGAYGRVLVTSAGVVIPSVGTNNDFWLDGLTFLAA